MTTIFIDAESRTILSDTRVTKVSYNGTKKYSTLQKVFPSKDGKYTIVASGDVAILHKYLLKYGFVLKYAKTKVTRGDNCNVVITNTYNNQVVVINKEKCIFKTKTTIKYVSGFGNITFGSGGGIARRAHHKGKTPLQSVRYAAMGDPFTNDIISVTKY